MTTARTPSHHVIVPSRAAALDDAAAATPSRRFVVITGPAGIGRTTFATLLLDRRHHAGHITHRIVASSAFTGVPFANLAALSAEISQADGLEIAPQDAIARLARLSMRHARTLLIDDAEYLDAPTAAAIAQLPGALEVIITISDTARLPEPLHRALRERAAHDVALTTISIHDAHTLLEHEFGDRFNSSSVNLLHNLAGGVPLQLREAARDAVDDGALHTVRGFRTLQTNWAPVGNRVGALVSTRLDGWSPASRAALECLAVTGPLPLRLVGTLIGDDALDGAIDDRALIVTTRRDHLDIAQSFDGPGASARLDHAEPWAALGGGLTPLLVQSTLSRRSWREIVSRIDDSIGLGALPAVSLDHLGQSLERRELTFPGFVSSHAPKRIDEELGEITRRIVRELASGRPDSGVALFREHVNGPLWHRSDSATKTALFQAMFLAMVAEGSPQEAFDDAFADIDWHDVGLDHAVFLTGYGYKLLEAGDAQQAGDFFAQAIALVGDEDPHELTGYLHGFDAAASIMVGDHERAAAEYARHREIPSAIGSIARPEAERLTLLVTRELDGLDAARTRYRALTTDAEHRGEHMHVLRLLHDAWRHRLIDDGDASAHLDRMHAVARRVNGTFASLLAQYAAAFAEIRGHAAPGVDVARSTAVHAAPARDARTIEELVAEHLAAGRWLLAAELAARGAEACESVGDRKRAGRLHRASAEAASSLPTVTTPSLGRVRIDSAVLSDRERQVCELAAAGLTTPEIAARFVLSPRTIEGHLQRAYAKLGVADRRQLVPSSAAVVIAR